MNKAITLWIPELLNSYRIEEAAEQIKNTKLPWLTRLLAKADALAIKPKQSFYQTASYLFHQPNTLPIAPVLASVELKNADLNEFWIKLDPVQLIADRDSLILIPAQDLAISQQESKQLLEAFNQHFAEDNLQLQYASKDSWLLSIVQAVDIQTTSIEELSYKPLHDAYPKGNAATFWKKLLNETQMLFYSHPVNEQRRNNNQPEINSIWAWGEGKLDTNKITARKQATIYSNNPYLQGIAKQTQAKYNTEIDSYKDYATKNKPKNGFLKKSEKNQKFPFFFSKLFFFDEKKS